MVQELGENRSARVHSSFSHPDLLLQAALFAYLTSNRKKLQSHLIPFVPVHWGDSSSRLPDSTDTIPVGLLRDFPKEKDAWREVDKLGLAVRINEAPCPGRIRFNALCEHYLKADFGADAVRPKSDNTTAITQHIVRDYLITRWGNEIAEDIKPLDIQRWLKSLNTDNELAWTTIAKMRGVMSRIYKVGILHEHALTNPVLHVQTRSKSSYRAIVITPQQTLTILNFLPAVLHRTLVLTCAATALRSSEILALRWADILWEETRIRVSKRWADGGARHRNGERRRAAFLLLILRHVMP